MKVYRFAVHPEEDGFLFLECISDPALFTQAKSMDEALFMARDVIECMYDHKGAIVEFVVPPDVTTPFERRRQQKSTRRRGVNGARSRTTGVRGTKRKTAA